MYKLCESLQIDYDKVVEYTLLMKDWMKSHWSIPVLMENLPVMGHCFPKDIQAMISLTDELQTPNHVLKDAKDTNDEVRKSRDWKKGRTTVVKKKKLNYTPWLGSRGD